MKIKPIKWIDGGLLHATDPSKWRKQICYTDTIFGRLKIIKLKIQGKIVYTCVGKNFDMPAWRTINEVKEAVEDFYYNKIKEALEE